jgi:hypothetical protein
LDVLTSEAAMHRLATLIAVAFAVALAPAVSEGAQKKQTTYQTKSQTKSYRRPKVIFRDRSLFRAPPPPHERNYYGPAPSIQPPMQRVPLPAPLAQPPIR